MAVCFNTTAQNWFLYTAFRAFPPPASMAECWPWRNVTINDWLYFVTKIDWVYKMFKISSFVILASICVGVVGSLGSILGVCRKAVREKERFYIWMFLISFCDLLFNLMYIPTCLAFINIWPNPFKYSYLGTQLLTGVMNGLLYAISLLTDLCTLALTIERYFAICRLTTYQNERFRKGFTIVSAILILLGGSTRFIRSGFEHEATEGGVDSTGRMTYTSKNTDVSEEVWFQAIVIFSDSLLPFLLLLFMIALSIRVTAAVSSRRKSRLFESASNQQQQQVQEQSTAMLRLLAVLVLLFVCNQIGYCFYAIMTILKQAATKPLTFEYTYEQVNTVADVYLAYGVSCLANFGLECLSRSLNFYFYVSMSASFRKDFRSLFRRVRVSVSGI